MRVVATWTVAAAAGLSLAALAEDDPKTRSAESGIDCTLYTKPYKATEHGAFALPDGLAWKVMPQYVGRTETGERVVDDRLTLVLVDEGRKFWPVIAKMPLEEAERLQQDLAKVIAEKKGE